MSVLGLAAAQPIINTFVAVIAVLIGLSSFIFAARATSRAEKRSAALARIEAQNKAAQLQAVGVGEVQSAIDALDGHIRSTQHVVHDLAVEMSRALNDGHRLDAIIRRVEEPLPEPHRLRDPLHHPNIDLS